MEINVEPKLNNSYFFLSNDSLHGFYDSEGYWWKSVTHYLEAKKFEGTQYESIIRQCKTPRQAKRFTRERKVLIVTPSNKDEISYNLERKKLYGVKRNGYVQVDNWPKLRESYLKIALNAKFLQHPIIRKKLVDTYPLTISNFDENETAKLLLQIRKKFLSDKKNTQSSVNNNKTGVDLKLANSEILLNTRQIIMELSKYISKMEGLDRIFPEMVSDAITIFTENLTNYTSDTYCDKKWSKMTKHIDDLPSLKKYSNETRKLFIKIDKFQKETDTPSQKIANFIFWITYDKERIIHVAKIVKEFLKITNKNGKLNFDILNPPITIPPGKRWYRNKIIPTFKKKSESIENSR